MIAYTLGVRIFEKHFRIEKDKSCVDYPVSLDKKQFLKMKQEMERIDKILGSIKFGVRNNEKNTKQFKRKKLSKLGFLKFGKRLKKVIPGGNGLLSKRPQRYVPDFWPTYYKKSKDLNVWDLEGNKYIDMAQMGVGTCVLGYANDFVNNRVIEGIKLGNNSTLNSLEEFQLAKKNFKN